MREMKDSGIQWIGKIPKEYQIIKLKYLLSQNDGGLWGEDPQDNINDKVVLRSTEQTIDGKWIILDPAIRCLGNGSNLRYYTIKNNDLLVTKSSGSPLHIGKTTLANSDLASKNYYYSNFLQRLHTKNALDAKFLWYIMNSPYSREQFVYMQNSTSGIGNINSENINDLIIALPNKNEQDLIALFLNKRCAEIDGITKDLQEQIETLENYKKSVITEAVTKGLNPNVDYNDNKKQWFRGIPKHWIVSRIAAIYKLRNTKVSDRDYPPLSVTMQGVVPQLENAAKSDAHDDRKLVCKGDFAINSRSDRRGSCGIAPMDGSISLINTVLCPLTNMNARYYNWLFHTVEFADEFYKWGHGIVNDLWTTNWQDMKNILIPRPPIQEQKEIANYLDTKCAEIDEIIKNKKEQLETIEEYKKSLIYEYVTGKKEVINA